MRHSIKTGVSFGLTSGIITTLGLMVGLHSGTHSRLAVAGGVLTIAIADSLSDAMGIHIAEESERVHSGREIWEATAATFISKFLFTLTFLAPLILFELGAAIVAAALWGLSLLCIFSYLLARGQETSPWKSVVEHLAIALVVIGLTHRVGDLLSSVF